MFRGWQSFEYTMEYLKKRLRFKPLRKRLELSPRESDTQSPWDPISKVNREGHFWNKASERSKKIKRKRTVTFASLIHGHKEREKREREREGERVGMREWFGCSISPRLCFSTRLYMLHIWYHTGSQKNTSQRKNFIYSLSGVVT